MTESTERSRLIDFRRTYWGHNLSIKTTEPGVLEGFCWCDLGPHVGDVIAWHTRSGEVRAVVEKADWTVNVDDMWEIRVRVTERIEA